MKIIPTLVFLALTFSMLISAGILLMHGSAWATPLFIGGVAVAMLGIWIESKGYELLFELITHHLPKK